MVLLDILHTDPTLTAQRPGQTVIGDKNYFGAEFETTLAKAGLTLLRPARKGEPDRSGSRFFKPLRQTIESIFDTYKGQLNLEDHGGQDPHRRPGPRPATHPRPHHRDLAQRPHRPTHQTLTARLRPLINPLESLI
jgi:hypothetical protein